MNSARNSQVGGKNLLGPDGKFKSAQKKVITMQRSLNTFKDIGSKNNALNDSASQDRRPSRGPPGYHSKQTQDMDTDGAVPGAGTGYENMRENQLRNELIRQKQQFLTLSNRLLNYSAEDKMYIEIQSQLTTIETEIEIIESQLRNVNANKKNGDLIDRLKNIKPGVPIASKISSDNRIPAC